MYLRKSLKENLERLAKEEAERKESLFRLQGPNYHFTVIAEKWKASKEGRAGSSSAYITPGTNCIHLYLHPAKDDGIREIRIFLDEHLSDNYRLQCTAEHIDSKDKALNATYLWYDKTTIYLTVYLKETACEWVGTGEYKEVMAYKCID